MKVLFAVQDEQISTRIVKEYQKKYKEIISYKNIYYFNAILTELQRNKNYDRIIIDEELEEISSASYGQRDKYIFDKLDKISDEAINIKGQDIPIILICSERRTKSEDIFVKLFGLGIYNAIIGNDRSTEEICKLIERPRSKKQAKMYYKIDSEEVQYKQENENDVSEEEMQNILMHFKKLGNNEEKYVESFSRIVKQYNKEQMKIIIKILPLNVRAVLEEKSEEYQKIIATNGNMRVRAATTQKEEKGTVEKLLGTNNNKAKITKPVVVPTTMKKNTVKKLTVKKPVQQYDIEELEDIDNVDNLEGTQEIQEVQESPEVIETPQVQAPKRRGRPKKNPDAVVEKPAPKKRGRPKKVNVVEELEEEIEEEIEEETFKPVEDVKQTNPKLEEEEQFSELPGFEEDYEENEDSEASSLPGFDDFYEEDEEESTELPGFAEQSLEEEYNNDTNFASSANNFKNTEIQQSSQEQYNYDYSNFENLLSADKKIVAFVGTSKNGTSFVVNNIAQYLSTNGINTAILDTTQNKNSYYIYTKNEEDLRNKAANSMSNLIRDNADGIKVNQNLTVYTSLPGQNEEMENVGPILDTLVKNHSAVLIDCDFNTPYEYFDKVQEMYLVQSMDVLTIQPLTAFLRELKAKNILEQTKIKILVNKALKLRSVSSKNIVGGMAYYNDPEMSFMTELFDREIVKYVEIPFDEEVYALYLEGIIECEITTNRYPKNFTMILKEIANMVYPLLPNGNNAKPEKKKRGYEYSTGFSSSVNNTLNNMKNRY